MKKYGGYDMERYFQARLKFRKIIDEEQDESQPAHPRARHPAGALSSKTFQAAMNHMDRERYPHNRLTQLRNTAE
jgi:hypothetical protein